MRSPMLALSSILFSLPSLAWDVRTDSEGDVVQWKKNLELVLDARAADQLGDARANDAIADAVGNFEAATPYLQVSMRVGEAKPIGYVVGAADNMNSILVLDEWPYSADALAVTLVTMNARTNEILDADVAFNIESHRFKVLPENAKEEHRFDDVQNTFTHELGHVLGLMHNNLVDDLVMYPSAAPGETLKRQLKTDDKDGLLSLYGTELPQVATDAPQSHGGGCSATAGPPSWLWCLPLLLMMAMRRRHWARVAVAVIPGLVLAAPSLPQSVERAQDLAVVKVVSVEAKYHQRHPGLIVSELQVRPSECLKGSCGQLMSVVVPGGRVGDIEQVVVHQPVPLPGEQLLVSRVNGRLQLLRVDAQTQQQIILSLRSAGSAGTQENGAPLSPAIQVPAITP